MDRRSSVIAGWLHLGVRFTEHHQSVVEVTPIDIGSAVVGVVGVVLAGRFYLELWRWARQCQQAQIAIAYKRKVQLSAPLVEWLLWCNQLQGAEENGRVVYRNGGITIAIIRRPKGRAIPQRLRRRKQVAAPTTKEGRWAAKDETVKT